MTLAPFLHRPPCLPPHRSDTPDRLLVSLLHALTVAVSGSSRRKRLAETLFSRLASSSPSPSSSSSSPCGVVAPRVPRPGLIRFLYEGCLFPPAAREKNNAVATATGPAATAASATASAAVAAAAAAVAESSLGPRCKKRESRRAAFALLSALCRGNEAHLRQTFVLLGGRDLVTKGFLDSDGESGGGGGGEGGGGEVGAGVGGGEQGGAAAVSPLDEGGIGVGVGDGEPWDYDPTSVLKASGQHVGLQNQVRLVEIGLRFLCPPALPRCLELCWVFGQRSDLCVTPFTSGAGGMRVHAPRYTPHLEPPPPRARACLLLDGAGSHVLHELVAPAVVPRARLLAAAAWPGPGSTGERGWGSGQAAPPRRRRGASSAPGKTTVKHFMDIC